jgi:hypothetical protein
MDIGVINYVDANSSIEILIGISNFILCAYPTWIQANSIYWSFFHRDRLSTMLIPKIILVLRLDN